MVRKVGDVARYEQSLSIGGSFPKKQLDTSAVELVQATSEMMAERAQKIDKRLFENALGQAENTIAANVARIEREYANDPAAMEEALTGWKEKFFEEIDDPQVYDRMSIQYDRTALLSIERAKDGQQRIIDDQARFGALQSLDAIEREFLGVSESLFSSNPAVAGAAAGSLQEIMDRLNGTLSQTDSQGMPLFSAEARFNRLSQAKDAGLGGAALAWVSRQSDKQAAIETIKNGGLTLNLPDGEGGVEKINVRDSLSPRALNMLESEAKRQESEAKANLIRQQEADIVTQINNQNQLMEMIQADGMSVDEKVFKINEMDLKGQIREDFATEARRYLSSAEKINAATDSAAMADIVTRMYDLNAMADTSPTEYLKGVQNVREEIIKARSDGKLSADDEVKLGNQLKTLTAAKTSDATQQLAYSFGEARKIIDTNLPPEQRGAAIRRMFYESEKLQGQAADPNAKEPVTQETYMKSARKIVDEYNAQRREVTLKTVQEVGNKPAAAPEEVETLLKEKGYSMRDVQETAKKYGISEQQVIEKLRAK
jgi:hypothetical protein